MPAAALSPKHQRLTDELVRGQPAPQKGYRITYDTECKRFGVRISDKGTRTYILAYDFEGRRGRSFSIGSADKITANAARKRAKALKDKIANGVDPQATRDESRAAVTVNELLDDYEKVCLPELSVETIANYTNVHKRIIRPRFGQVKITDVSQEDIAAVHKELGRDGVRCMANRFLRSVRLVYNWAIENKKFSGENPTKRIELFPEYPKDRFMTRAEQARAVTALKAHPDTVAARVLLFLLVTGARIGETLVAKWSHINRDEWIWTKPAATTKGGKRTGKPHRVRLRQAPIALLTEMLPLADEHGYVFPNIREAIIRGPKRYRCQSKADYKAYPSKAEQETRRLTRKLFEHENEFRVFEVWDEVRKQTGVADVRIHDLRHTFAANALRAGVSLHGLSKILGHASVRTTERHYAHLCDEALQHATELMDRADAESFFACSTVRLGAVA